MSNDDDLPETGPPPECPVHGQMRMIKGACCPIGTCIPAEWNCLGFDGEGCDRTATSRHYALPDHALKVMQMVRERIEAEYPGVRMAPVIVVRRRIMEP